jgi:putative membrane protein
LWRNLQRWRGVVLVSAVTVATVVLALTNQLQLYIHPRYILFTVIMVVIGGVVLVASLIVRASGEEDSEEVPARASRAFSYVGLVLAAAVAVGMLALPPATLTSATAQQRDVSSTTVGADTQDAAAVASAPAAAFSSFTVIDWASLLRQTTDVSFYRDKPVSVVGFIVPDSEDPDNVFYVSRFFVTCCAVDAQPTGIPVYYPDWSATLDADAWVQVSGTFETNPSSVSTQPLAVQPSEITPVEQPSDPYLY